MRRRLVCVWLAWTAVTTTAYAQVPGVTPDAPATVTPGFLTRTVATIGLAHLTSDDPRFNWAARFSGDIDVADYRTGRVTLFGTFDGVFGSERRAFDLNHASYGIDLSASWRHDDTEWFATLHHVSRHLSDRFTDHAIAWNTLDVAAERRFRAGETTGQIRLDLGKVIQRTYVDYTWTAWLSTRASRPLSARLSWFFNAAGGLQGVDPAVAHRERLCGARLETGLHVSGRAGGARIYVAYERRIDAYPTAQQRGRFVEFGVRVGG